jgi:hypothetical protein
MYIRLIVLGPDSDRQPSRYAPNQVFPEQQLVHCLSAIRIAQKQEVKASKIDNWDCIRMWPSRPMPSWPAQDRA